MQIAGNTVTIRYVRQIYICPGVFCSIFPGPPPRQAFRKKHPVLLFRFSDFLRGYTS